MERMTMTVKEMASYLGVSRVKAYELVHCKGFPTLRIGTRILIPTTAFEEWLKKNTAVIGGGKA